MAMWRTIDSAPTEGRFDLWADGRRVPNAERASGGGFRVWHRFQPDLVQASSKEVTGAHHYRAVSGATHWKPIDNGPSSDGLRIEILVPTKGNTTAHFQGGEQMDVDAALATAINALEAERRDLKMCPYHNGASP